MHLRGVGPLVSFLEIGLVESYLSWHSERTPRELCDNFVCTFVAGTNASFLDGPF